jgi:ferric-dicitrate binding protein FerR (iron transport regulator)
MSSLETTSTTLHMGAGQFLHCAEQRPVWLSVLRGRVWVTHALDPDDHFLDPGQSIRLPAGAQALVGSETAAQVLLMEDAGPTRGRIPGATIGAPPPEACPQP